MRIINRTIKFFACLGLNIVLYVQTYVSMLFVTASLMGLSEAVASLFKVDLHAYMMGFSYMEVLLMLNIPLSIVMQILLMSGVFKHLK